MSTRRNWASLCKLYLFGPEVLNRGQPHGTFKLFFNGVLLSGAEEVAVRAASEF